MVHTGRRTFLALSLVEIDTRRLIRFPEVLVLVTGSSCRRRFSTTSLCFVFLVILVRIMLENCKNFLLRTALSLSSVCNLQESLHFFNDRFLCFFPLVQPVAGASRAGFSISLFLALKKKIPSLLLQKLWDKLFKPLNVHKACPGM